MSIVTHPAWAAPQTVTHAQWQTVQAACLAAVAHGASSIDWATCTHMDSTALALAIAAQRTCKTQLQHLSAPSALVQLAQLHGVDELLGLL